MDSVLNEKIRGENRRATRTETIGPLSKILVYFYLSGSWIKSLSLSLSMYIYRYMLEKERKGCFSDTALFYVQSVVVQRNKLVLIYIYNTYPTLSLGKIWDPQPYLLTPPLGQDMIQGQFLSGG